MTKAADLVPSSLMLNLFWKQNPSAADFWCGSKAWLWNADQNPGPIIHEKPIPDSAAPAAGKNGSWPEAGKKRKINKTETGILCSENKLFQITLLI